MNWRDAAACAGTATSPATDLFFPAEGATPEEREANLHRAQSYCRSCLVRRQCHAESETLEQRWGVWGGVNYRAKGIKPDPASSYSRTPQALHDSRRALHAAGATDQEIADAEGGRRTVIALWRHRVQLKPNLTLPRNGITEATKERWAELYEAGWSDHQIADATGCSNSPVKRWRYANDLPTQTERRQAALRAEAAG